MRKLACVSDGGVAGCVARADLREGIQVVCGLAYPRECPRQGRPHRWCVVGNRRGKQVLLSIQVLDPLERPGFFLTTFVFWIL
jgi:hypothetical protein